MDNVTNLDFLLERESRGAGKVSLKGVEYDVLRVDTVEHFLTFMAVTEKIKAEMENVGSADQLEERLEQMRAALRRMIRMFCPGMSEDFLKTEFHDLERLHKLFFVLVGQVEKSIPESVKKNCEPTRSDAATTPEAASETPATSCSSSADSHAST